jgi:hypothetical protein
MLECRRDAEAVDAGAEAHAAWADAESSARTGEAALAAQAYGEASAAFDGSAARYREAARLAREAARARESARSEATAAAESSAAARAVAVERGAARYAAGPWASAERADTLGRAAMDRREHGAALAHFTEAARLYAGAAHAARAAQEAERRRADAMLADARRLLAAGELDACLERLDDVVALDPAHPGTAELRLEVDRRRRDIEAARAATVPGASPADALAETTRLEPPGPAPTSTPGGVRAETAASGRADATVLLDGVETGEVLTRIAGGPAPGATLAPGAGPTTGMPREAGPGGSPRFADAARGPGARAQPGRAMRGTILHALRQVVARRPVMAGVVGAAVAVAALVAYVGLRPPAPPEALRQQVAEARNAAVAARAGMGPSFNRAGETEAAAANAVARKDMKTGARLYDEALAGYRAAASEALQAAAAVRGLESEVAELRRAAEAAQAPGRATEAWGGAERARQAATAASEQGDFDRARARFAEAKERYAAAEREARDSHARSLAADTEQARTRALGARREAERADARRLATASFLAARQKEHDASIALDRADVTGAATGFKDAQRSYDRAAQEAAVQRRADAAQARQRAAHARREAHQAGAGHLAAALFAWAERKERDAGDAFQRSELAEAERLFSEAQADYEHASREASRRLDGGASIGRSAEQAQRRMASYRERASKAGADRRAAALFTRARAKVGPAEMLMAQRNFALARDWFMEAGDLYQQAAHQAAEQSEADATRARMLAEKQRTAARGPGDPDGAAEEKAGVLAYERRAYKEAGERFRAAGAFYASAAAGTIATPALAGGSAAPR